MPGEDLSEDNLYVKYYLNVKKVLYICEIK